MLGFRKKDAGPAVTAIRPAQGGDSRPDATTGFPRGLPDNDPYKATATARWPSTAEMAQWSGLETWQPGMFLLGRDSTGRYVGYRDDRHILTVAGSRAGKGVSLIVPNLLLWPSSAVCIDPKGELASLTASRRSGEGSVWSMPMKAGEGKVYALDPFRLVTGDARQFALASFNPMADLDPATDEGSELAYQIADALIIQAEGEGAHWTQSARSFLRGLIMYVAAANPGTKSLILVRRLVSQGREDREKTFAAMAAMASENDLIGRIGAAMKARPPNEAGSIMSACETQTAFLEGTSMKQVLTGSSFRLEDLKKERITVYLCLPAMHIATHGRWLRLMVALAVNAMEKTGPLILGNHPVLFCLDEFSALGRMESVEKAAGQIASFGVKLWPVVQDLTQLQRDYKESWETFMGNAGLLTFFGNTDISTADHISKRLGQVELLRTTMNGNLNWAQSENKSLSDSFRIMMDGGGSGGGGAGSGSEGATTGGSRTMSQQVTNAPLMHPPELIQHFARGTKKLLAMIPEYPPFALYRCEHHSVDDDKMFGGLYDEIPGQPAPRTNRAQREARQD